jgi:hypothetical protein
MSNANHIGNRPRWPGTLAISAGALVLGIPLAIAALRLAQTDVSDITLGQKEIKAGPNGETKTITFGLLTGVTDAIVAGSYISIISSLVFVVGLVVLRHFSQHNILGWMLVFPALVNLFGNVGCMGYAFVQNGKEKMASSAEEVPRNPTTGTYDTGGKLYTREAWACMMDRFYHDQEGEWAESACSGLVCHSHADAFPQPKHARLTRSQ